MSIYVRRSQKYNVNFEFEIKKSKKKKAEPNYTIIKLFVIIIICSEYII